MSLLEDLPEAVLSYLCTEFLPERDHDSVTRTSKELRRGTVEAYRKRMLYTMYRTVLLQPIKTTLEWALRRHIEVLAMEYPVSTAAVDEMAQFNCSKILEADVLQEERINRLARSKSWSGYVARTMKILEPNDEMPNAKNARIRVLPEQRSWREQVAWARGHLARLG